MNGPPGRYCDATNAFACPCEQLGTDWLFADQDTQVRLWVGIWARRRCRCGCSNAGSWADALQRMLQHSTLWYPLTEAPCSSGLRALQGRQQLEKLVAAVKAQRDRAQWPAGPPPLLVKVAPDLTPDEMKVREPPDWQRDPCAASARFSMSPDC